VNVRESRMVILAVDAMPRSLRARGMRITGRLKMRAGMIASRIARRYASHATEQPGLMALVVDERVDSRST
jgi:hypothetical protein